MQNLIVLCHRCFTWGETYSDICTECGADVCLDLPDIDRDTLAEILGKPLTVLGPMRVERPLLPNYGYLIGTTGGVLFLPRLHRRINGAWEGITSQRLPGWWPFRGDLASPRFLNWLRRPLSVDIQDQQKSEPLSAQSMDSLTDRLMDSPGGFFIELRYIQSITARRRRVKLDRAPLKSELLIDETEDGSLLINLNSHVARAANEKLRPAL